MTYPATIAYFRRKRKGTHGLDFWCKGCTRTYGRSHYYKYQQGYVEKSKEWYEANKDRAHASSAAWAAANRERAAFFVWRWAQANMVRRRLHAANRRARIRANGGEIAVEVAEQMYEDQDGLCAYCECELGETFELDHMIPVILGGGGSWENIAITCKPCNRKKARKTVEEFMEVLMK